MTNLSDRFTFLTPAVLVASNNIFSSGQGSAFDLRQARGIALVVLIAEAGAGTGRTFDFTIEDSEDGVSDWQTIATMDRISGPTNAFVRILPVNADGARRYIRARYVFASATAWRWGASILYRAE